MWILIVLLSVHNSVSSLSVEFTTHEKCTTAKEAIHLKSSVDTAVCVKK